MTFSTSCSATTIPSTWPTLAHQTIAKIVAKVHSVPRQDSGAGYYKNYCASCPRGWGLTKAGQISIWVFGGLFLIAVGIAIGYIWRKCRGQSILDQEETARRAAEVSNRDATITELRATITRLKKDIKEANKEKAKETISLSAFTTSNDAGPPKTTTAFNKGKGKAKDNDTFTDPSSDPTAIEMSPDAAPKGKTLATGAVQENSQSLPDERSSGDVAPSSSGVLDGPSTQNRKPRKTVSERIAVVVQEGTARRAGEAGVEPFSTSQLSSGRARKLTTLERHGSAHRQITGNS